MKQKKESSSDNQLAYTVSLSEIFVPLYFENPDKTVIKALEINNENVNLEFYILNLTKVYLNVPDYPPESSFFI